MSEERLPKEICDFLGRYTPTVGHLEILLFLYEGRERSWSIQELSLKMRTNHSMVENHLSDLRALVKKSASGEYCFMTENAEALQRMERVAELYRTHKHVIICEIYSHSLGSIRSFADAFKIKKDEE